MTDYHLGLLVVFAPLATAALLMLWTRLRHTGKLAAYLSAVGALTSFGAAVALLLRHSVHHMHHDYSWSWLVANGESIADVGILLDGISIGMLAVVALVSTCVQIYSLSYMADEQPEDFGRYFTWHSLFLFSMQALVVSPNLLQLFMAWELVGLCSYLLIGFYYRKPAAGQAALKAFWMTKLADIGFLLALILQYVVAGDFGWGDTTVSALVASGGLGTFVAAGYFLAVMGKSAQFPLHIWLPDAMEGPTPVSALLHAATMVAAGVYLIVRAYPIFQAAPDVMMAMALIGGFTAFFAGCVATVQSDIKKVLAYSTCSQLGYMVAALGSGGLFAGYFHLTTHAFFKALLFLAAGSVIHAVHTNELREMGGLWRSMKFTTLLWLIGTAALMGLPLMSGFYSKDLVLEAIYEARGLHPAYLVSYLLCSGAVLLTAFYMFRATWLTFFGRPSKRSQNAHESDVVMLAPMAILGVLSISAGWAGTEIAHLYGMQGVHVDVFHFSPVGLVATALALGGLFVGVGLYVGGLAEHLRRPMRPVRSFVEYAAVDKAFEGTYRVGLHGFAGVLAWFDRYVIDGMVNASGYLTLQSGRSLRAIQTGRVNHYVYVVVAAITLLAAWSQMWGEI
jgi:NADH-quinone oxidoreductase subunit L